MDFAKMRKDPKSKEARDLSIGDIVHSGFGHMAVVSRPVAGYDTPRGKVEIIFKYLEGRHIDLNTKKIWGKYTPIRVEGNINDPIPNPAAVVADPQTPDPSSQA